MYKIRLKSQRIKIVICKKSIISKKYVYNYLGLIISTKRPSNNISSKLLSKK